MRSVSGFASGLLVLLGVEDPLGPDEQILHWCITPTNWWFEWFNASFLGWSLFGGPCDNVSSCKISSNELGWDGIAAVCWQIGLASRAAERGQQKRCKTKVNISIVNSIHGRIRWLESLFEGKSRMAKRLNRFFAWIYPYQAALGTWNIDHMWTSPKVSKQGVMLGDEGSIHCWYLWLVWQVKQTQKLYPSGSGSKLGCQFGTTSIIVSVVGRSWYRSLFFWGVWMMYDWVLWITSKKSRLVVNGCYGVSSVSKISYAHLGKMSIKRHNFAKGSKPSKKKPMSHRNSEFACFSFWRCCLVWSMTVIGIILDPSIS